MSATPCSPRMPGCSCAICLITSAATWRKPSALITAASALPTRIMLPGSRPSPTTRGASLNTLPRATSRAQFCRTQMPPPRPPLAPRPPAHQQSPPTYLNHPRLAPPLFLARPLLPPAPPLQPLLLVWRVHPPRPLLLPQPPARQTQPLRPARLPAPQPISPTLRFLRIIV